MKFSKDILFVQFLIFLVCLSASYQKQSQYSCKHNKTFDWKKEHRAITTSKVPINVYVIPHSHDDPGWLKTFGEYYYGINMRLQYAGVQYILDTVIEGLVQNQNRTFVYVEMAYFMKWWNEQTKEKKQIVRKLVKNKQLEFPLGGYCQSDEATTYYEDIIDQMTLGNLFLKEEFDFIASYGWNIDNFGHSATEAALLSQMGFTGFVVARIDYEDKDLREQNRGLEMNWIPFQKSGEKNNILFHVAHNFYSAPWGYGFDVNGGAAPPIVEDMNSVKFNVKERAEGYVNYYMEMKDHYLHPHMLQMHGDDFNWVGAHEYYKNLDKLIKYIQEHQEYGLNISYSVPSKYFEAVKKEKVDFPVKNDDFFPYADWKDAFWTGYYVSRIMKKYVIKEYGRYLQTYRTLFSLLKINGSIITPLDIYNKVILEAEKAIALNLHHDGITGTEKQKVANDYMMHLINNTVNMNKILHDEISSITKNGIDESLMHVQCKWNLTSKECPLVYDALLNNKIVLLTIYHPTMKGNVIVRIKVPIDKLSIIDIDNRQVQADVFCFNTTDPTDCDLFFIANLDPYSFTFYKIYYNPASSLKIKGRNILVHQVRNSPIYQVPLNESTSMLITNEFTKFTLLTQNNLKNPITFEIKYNYYKSYQGKGQYSGAYIFRPDQSCKAHSIPYSKVKKSWIYQGKVLNQLSFEGTNITYHMRFYQNIEYWDQQIEIETFVHPIELYDPEIKENQGKEITMNIITDIKNNKTFYTDSNGLELQKRILNFRPTWNVTIEEPSSANYYPINAMIYIEDIETKKGLFVLNDRSQGGSSLKEGEIEIMIHRRLAKDDMRGVGEPLNELDWDGKGLRVKMRHYILFAENGIENENPARKIQFFNDNKDLLFFAESSSNSWRKKPAEIERKFDNDFQQKMLLKTNLKIMKDNTYLLRFSSLDSFNNLEYLIDDRKYNATEVCLTATQKIEEMWKMKELLLPVKIEQPTDQPKTANGVIQIKRLQLKAFLIKKLV